VTSTDRVAVVIHGDICVGIGACAAAEPLAFELTEDGVSRVLPGALLERVRAERVCSDCPSGAISIVEQE
jgi:ferredoxin